MITITVITCTYNAAECLGRTLDSVDSQTHTAVEHIIVDGASADGTLALAEAYRQRTEAAGGTPHHRIVVSSEPDKGLYDAMNKGLAMATGDYVLFLNAGDTFPSSETLGQVCTKAEMPSMQATTTTLPAVLYGDTDIVDADGNRLRPRRLRPPRQLTWRSFRQGMLVCHQAFYARTDLARKTPYNLNYHYSADVDWCIRVMRLADLQRLELRNMEQVVACYQEDGMTTRHHRASLIERFRVMASHYGWCTTVAMHSWFVVRAIPLFLSRPPRE